MAVRGVRSSWLTTAENSSFIRAISTRSPMTWASRSARARDLDSVMMSPARSEMSSRHPTRTKIGRYLSVAATSGSDDRYATSHVRPGTASVLKV